LNNGHGSKNQGRDVWNQSMIGLANSLAVLITFLAVPELYARSIDWISNYTATRYGPEFIPVCELAWFVILGCIVFFTARAGTAALVISGGMALAMRML
jgi:hypothetical protein